MLRKIFLFGLTSLLAFSAFAQHCVYDGSTMIMLDIKKGKDIRLGKIYLLDSADRLVMSRHIMNGTTKSDTAIFWQNPGKEVKVDYFERGRNYSFAKDYEILELGAHDQPMPYKVAIHYWKGNKEFVKEVPLLSNHMHMLCTSDTALWSGHTKPMIVWL